MYKGLFHRVLLSHLCLCAKQTGLTRNMAQLCQSVDGKRFQRGDLHEKQKCFVERFILSPKEEEINSHLTSNRDNHIYSFESIKFHTIKATFQGESTTSLRFTQRKHRPSLLFSHTVQFCGKIKELFYSTTEWVEV